MGSASILRFFRKKALMINQNMPVKMHELSEI